MAIKTTNHTGTDYRPELDFTISRKETLIKALDGRIYEVKLYMHKQTDYYKWAKRKTEAKC